MRRGNGEQGTRTLLGVPGHRPVDSFPGLVIGKGLLWVIYWEREGGRTFTFGLSLDSAVGAAELLLMSVYVSQAREPTAAPTPLLFLLCNPKQVVPPH